MTCVGPIGGMNTQSVHFESEFRAKLSQFHYFYCGPFSLNLKRILCDLGALCLRKSSILMWPVFIHGCNKGAVLLNSGQHNSPKCMRCLLTQDRLIKVGFNRYGIMLWKLTMSSVSIELAPDPSTSCSEMSLHGEDPNKVA